MKRTPPKVDPAGRPQRPPAHRTTDLSGPANDGDHDRRMSFADFLIFGALMKH